jgi:hypothetical protein
LAIFVVVSKSDVELPSAVEIHLQTSKCITVVAVVIVVVDRESTKRGKEGGKEENSTASSCTPRRLHVDVGFIKVEVGGVSQRKKRRRREEKAKVHRRGDRRPHFTR